MIKARQRVAIYLRVSTTEQTTANQEGGVLIIVASAVGTPPSLVEAIGRPPFGPCDGPQPIRVHCHLGDGSGAAPHSARPIRSKPESVGLCYRAAVIPSKRGLQHVV
jgi:hypothetical protein